MLNISEHRFEIRSSSFILSYQFVSVIAGVITTLSILQTRSTLSHHRSTFNTPDELYFTYFGIISLGLIIEVWPHNRKCVQQRSHGNLYEDASIFSRYWFHYLQSVIALGFRQPLQQTDIQDMMPQRIKTKFSHLYLSEQWGHHVARQSAQGKKPKLMLLVLRAYASQWVPIIIYRVLASALGFVAPELMNQLLDLIASSSSDTPQPVALGVKLSFGMFFSTIASALLEGQYYQLVTNMGIEAHAALVSMVYRKALKLSPAARKLQTPGEISNHMSVDAKKWSNVLPMLPMWGSVPLEICIALWLLYRQLGWAALAGFGTIIIFMPFQARIATLLSAADGQKLDAMVGLFHFVISPALQYNSRQSAL